jgi:hypothetical protein
MTTPRTKDDGVVIASATPGCFLRREDAPLLLSSFACFAGFIVYGACVASLGAALPSVASHFNKTEAEFGVVFTVRGIGFLIGTFLSMYILQLSSIWFSKQTMACMAISLLGLTTGLLVAIPNNFTAAIVIFFVQGLSFGGL